MTNALVMHGVAQEMVHLRCHVVPDSKLIFVFSQQNAIEMLKVAPERKYDVIKATQAGVDGITGVCYGIPFGKGLGEKAIPIPDSIWDRVKPFSYAVRNDLTTTQKGNKALYVVNLAIQNGLLNLLDYSVKTGLSIITDKQTQIEGADIIVSYAANVRVQVKCDLRAAVYHTLALQVAERNPRGMY